jgi:hypothetical protein
MRRDQILIVIFFCLLVITVAYYGLSWILTPRIASPEELAEQALTADTIQEKEMAATKLASLGNIAEKQIVEVFNKTNEPGVRAAMIEGLGTILSFDHMDAILAALNDDSEWMRGRAAFAVHEMLDYNFPVEETPEVRAKALLYIRDCWNKLRNSPDYPVYVEKRKQLAEDRLSEKNSRNNSEK